MPTIIIAILLVIGTLNGLRRGLLKEAVALIGVLLGALLAQGWGVAWARQYGATVVAPGSLHSWGERVLTLGLLFGVALLTGYGSGALVPQRIGKPSLIQRLGGAVLGLLNWGLLCAFTLSFVQQLWFSTSDGTLAINPHVVGPVDPGSVAPPAAATLNASWIMHAPVTRLLVERLGSLLLLVAAAFAVLSLVAALTRSGRRRVAARRLNQAGAASLPEMGGSPTMGSSSSMTSSGTGFGEIPASSSSSSEGSLPDLDAILAGMNRSTGGIGGMHDATPHEGPKGLS
ncbi:MAG: hypothetical protein NVSMB42_09610 [Herpetosiphon sp.]